MCKTRLESLTAVPLEDLAQPVVRQGRHRAVVRASHGFGRDRDLLKRAAVVRGYFVRATNSRDQFSEVVERFRLRGRMQPFSRCALQCANQTGRERRDSRAPLAAHARAVREFFECPACGRVDWAGSHYEEVAR